ncbi:helix-turn-helix domain-containing protein [Pelosinus baikalensis]|uniref:Helix-turn-helix domain-containing protein n=1 Tax=Pelosinus baikalensis TaxID=2892015 RepID=A0ABS8HWW0_9FIRM|nr:helix-turn-helix transcriptional regulator [Pelosinus baikalensis]MCC5467661.1 helix-turn-helix domain-containing protein [Pelosinus baikalensis]
MKREWLIRILKNRKLTHQDAANLSKIERSYFTQIVNGTRRPSPEIAQQMGKALKFDWTIFFNQQCGVKPLEDRTDGRVACFTNIG